MAEDPEVTTDGAPPATQGKQAETKPAETSKPAAEQKPREDRFTVEQLMEAPRALLGCSRHALVGALHGVSKTSLTLREAQRRVDEFLSREAA